MKILLSLLSVALMAAAPAHALAQGKSDAALAAKPGPLSIVEIVVADDGEFDVLQAAVVRAGLVDALNGNRQFTVFAPTDDAFVTTLGVVDEASAIAVVNALELEDLTRILLYHVVAGRHTSTSVLAAPMHRTLGGETLSRESILEAGVAAVDISASNGVVHIINSVLLPE